MQVALRAAWREHRAAGIRLVEAYESVGGVLGALANEAEAARRRLEPDDQARLESIFVRLVRLGDTGGATRRTASLDEFDEARRALLQRLGRDEYRAAGRRSAKRAPRSRTRRSSPNGRGCKDRLRDDARDVRRLDRLMEKAQRMARRAGGPERRPISRPAPSASRSTSSPEQRADWLSALDRDFVEAVEPRPRERTRKGAAKPFASLATMNPSP